MCFKLTLLCLMQCGYFNSMFSGQWKEADECCIRIDILDGNIDDEGVLASNINLFLLIVIE